MITWRLAGHALMAGLAYLSLAWLEIDLLLVLFLLLILLPLLSFLQLLLARRRLKVSQRLEPAIAWKDDPVQIEIQIHQASWLSHGLIRLTVEKPGTDGAPSWSRHSLVVPGGSSARLSIPLDIPHRGIYWAGLRKVWCRDLFGFFYLRAPLGKAKRRTLMQLTILPRPDRIPGFESLVNFLSGPDKSRSPQAGDEVDDLANLRARHPGESLKRVHWKVSARLDQWVVKEFENPIRQTGLLILDMSRPNFLERSSDECLDLADFFTGRAAYLYQQLLNQRFSLRTVSYQASGRIEWRSGAPGDILGSQMMLAALDWSDSSPAGAVLTAETGQPGEWFVLLFSTRLDEVTAQELAQLKEQGREVFCILQGETQDDPALESRALETLHSQDIPVLVSFRREGEHDERR